MELNQASITELEDVGRNRFEELLQIEKLYGVDPVIFFNKLTDLSWIQIKQDFKLHSDLSEFEWYYGTLLEFTNVVKQLIIHRGPLILGYLDKIEFNYNPEFNAKYYDKIRKISISLGVLFLINELEFTFNWIYDTLITSKKNLVSLKEIVKINIPENVKEELQYIYQLGNTGSIAISGKCGATHPIGQTITRFIIAHEFGHLIYSAESPKVKNLWRDTVWSDYDDALSYTFETHEINPSKFERFEPHRLEKEVLENWELEFIADGMGFYIAKQLTNSPVDYQMLQIGVEVFLHTLVIAYHGDTGTEDHPPPSLRELVIVAQERKDLARQRKEPPMKWAEFLAQGWGSGTMTKFLFEKIIDNIRRN